MFNFAGRGVPSPAVDTEHYKTLGVEKKATAADIKKAYRKLAIKCHPDKGGDPEEFNKINEAFEVLSDEAQREIYDKCGKAGVENFHRGGPPEDAFSQVFGGGGTHAKKGKSAEHSLKVTLEELYCGRTRKLQLSRVVTKCKACDGRGFMVQRVRGAGDMIQLVQQPCECDRGYRMKTVRVKELLEVHVPKGAVDGHRLTFHEKGDEHPSGAAGDLHIKLSEQPHPTFRRHGADLYIKKDISLVEALCGFQLEIVHLDGRKLLVQSQPGKVTKPTAFDPFAVGAEDGGSWEVVDNCSCEMEPFARAEVDDVAKLKELVSTGQLAGKGITAFAVQGSTAVFFQGTRDEVTTAKATVHGATLHVMEEEPVDDAACRMMSCVEGEGLPSPNDPMASGNLFLSLNVVFPTAIDPAAVAAVTAALGPPLNQPTWRPTDPAVETHLIKMADPVASFDEHKVDAASSGATGEDDDEEGEDGQRVQCAQQ